MLARGEREINQLLLKFVCCRFAFGFSGPPLVSTWICFTDGACEQECSIGGVLVSPQGTAVMAFGSVLPQEFAQHFFIDSKHPIYEVELLPLLVSLAIWGDGFDKCQVVFYVDNDSARAGLIKGAGATRMADAIIEYFCARESMLQLKVWFSRVPSHSNISDGPSRSDFSLIKRLGCAITHVPWQTIGPVVLSRLKEVGLWRGVDGSSPMFL